MISNALKIIRDIVNADPELKRLYLEEIDTIPRNVEKRMKNRHVYESDDTNRLILQLG